MRSARFLTLLVFAAAGCTVEVDYGNTRFKCPDGSCPGDSVCIAGMCEAPGAPDAALPNLLGNGTLEVGQDPWTPFAGTFRGTTNMPHSGLRAAVICKTATGTPELFTIYQDAIKATPIAVGTRFRGSIFVRASFMSGESPPPSLKLVLRERGGAQPQRDHSGPVVMPITTTWAELTIEATIADPGRTDLHFIVWPGVALDGVCFAIDDGNLWQTN